MIFFYWSEQHSNNAPDDSLPPPREVASATRTQEHLDSNCIPTQSAFSVPPMHIKTTTPDVAEKTSPDVAVTIPLTTRNVGHNIIDGEDIDANFEALISIDTTTAATEMCHRIAKKSLTDAVLKVYMEKAGMKPFSSR